MKVSLIIPVYNALEDVKKCIKSIEKNYNISHELIIIDDYSNKIHMIFYKKELIN